jgi:hypothetical protein
VSCLRGESYPPQIFLTPNVSSLVRIEQCSGSEYLRPTRVDRTATKRRERAIQPSNKDTAGETEPVDTGRHGTKGRE